MSARPKRPTSLSLENICCPDFSSDFIKSDYIRHSKSFTTDYKYQQNFKFTNNKPLTFDRELEPFLSSAKYEKVENDKLSERLSTYSSYSHSFSRTDSGDSQYFAEIFAQPEKVDVCVATANGKIGPDIRRKPRPIQRIKVKTPTNIDFSFSKGRKKEVSTIDFSLARSSAPKKPTCEDYSFNKSLSSSRRPTKNDYSYGDHTYKAPTRRDYSYCKNSDPKPATKYNFTYAPSRPKPTTKYDYRYNWEQSKAPTRYNYTYYRGYKLLTTSYDYSYNTVS